MKNMIKKRLPDSEFAIMKIIWRLEEPVTSPAIMANLTESDLKQQTVITVLSRLEKKGFLRSEKPGKEREYYTLISEEEYMRFEASSFLNKFNKQFSLKGLAAAFYDNGKLDQESIDELQEWLNKREKE